MLLTPMLVRRALAGIVVFEANTVLLYQVRRYNGRKPWHKKGYVRALYTISKDKTLLELRGRDRNETFEGSDLKAGSRPV